MQKRLVGRAEVVAYLRDELADPSAAVLLVGEAGVGKTALVEQVVPDAPRGGGFSALAALTYLPLKTALPDLEPDVWTGDAEYVADRVRQRLDGTPLVIEDVQWVDPASRSVLGLLARRTPILATVRQGDPAAAAVVAELEAVGLTTVGLDPLSPSAASELVLNLNPALAGTRIAEVVSAAGGNPLIIEELARVDGADSFRLALTRRLAPLSAHARDGMLLLAAASRPLDEDAVPGADELRAAALAAEVGGGQLQARHGLIADAVLADASPEAVVDAHRLLASIATDDGERARHLLAVGDDAAAYDAAMVAAHSAASPAERSAHLETAAACSRAEARADLLLRAAHEANRALDAARALALLAEVPTARAARADAVAERGIAVFETGDADGWIQSVRDGLAADGTPAERIYFRVEEAAVAYFVEGDPAKAAELASAAGRDAETAGLPRAGALRMEGSALYLMGDPAWPSTMERALAAARDEDDIPGTFSALNNLVTAHESGGDPAEAVRRCDEAIAEASERRLGRWTSQMETRRVSLALHAGDHALVEELAAALLARPLADRSREEVACALALSRIDLGRADDALALADQHLSGSGLRPSDYHVVRAQAFLATGRARAALSEHEPFVAAQPVQSLATAMAPVFAWAAHFAGRPEPARTTELLDWGMLAGATPELAGIDAIRAGRHEEAAAHFEEAAGLYDRYSTRAALRARWAHADALLHTSRRDEGTAAMSRVEATAEAVGLAPVLRLVARSLNVPQTSAQHGPTALTAAERRVLELVRDGLSDAAIATRLGSSRRTVESQVAAAQRKLGASNRRHAAHLIADETE